MHRSVISAVEQGFVAVATAALPLFVAYSANPVTFGVFALMHLVAVIVLGAARSSLFPLVVKSFRPDRTCRGLAGMVWAGSIVSTLAMWLVASQWPHLPLALYVVALACWLLGSILLEGKRAVLYAHGRLRSAALVSMSQVLAALLGIAAFVSGLSADDSTLLIGGATLGLAVVWLRGGVFPTRAALTVPELRELRSFVRLYIPGALLMLLVPWGFSYTVGPVAVGSFRLAQSIVGLLIQPVQVLRHYVYLRAVDRSRSGSEYPVRLVLLGGVSVVVGVALAAYLVSRLTREVGLNLFGESWRDVAAIMTLVAISIALGQVIALLELVIKANGWSASFERLKFLMSLTAVLVAWLASSVWGLREGVASLTVVQGSLFIAFGLRVRRIQSQRARA